MPPKTTHVSSTSASPICSAPRTRPWRGSIPPADETLRRLCRCAERQTIGAQDETNRRKHDRPADQGPLDRSRDGAVDQEKGGQYGSILVQFSHVSHRLAKGSNS